VTGESHVARLRWCVGMNVADYRWRDDVWTMKYLSGFKWEMLGEQVGMSTFQIFF
jgi:hypothetical protein